MPDKLGINPKSIVEDVDGIAITVASWKLDDRYVQVYALDLTVIECAAGL